MKNKTVNIDNFIGIYDNYILPEECNKAIKLFEEQDKFNRTMNRLSSEGKMSILKKQDQQFFAASTNLDVWWEDLKTMMVNFDIAWNHYVENTGAKDAYGVPFHFY